MGSSTTLRSARASTTTTTTPAKTTSTNQSGWYTFKVNTNIRSAASTNAAIKGIYYAGESVYYVGTVQAGGYEWLKYVSTNGGYRYVAVVD